MLRLRTMSGGYRAQLKGSPQFAYIMEKICAFLPAKGVEDVIFFKIRLKQNVKTLQPSRVLLLHLLDVIFFTPLQEYSVNFESIKTAELCHKLCGKNDDCKWWTWEPDNSLCSLFANCTDPTQGTGHPDAGPCPNCISGQRE